MRTPTSRLNADGSRSWYVRYRVQARDGGKDGSTSQRFDTEADAVRFARLLDLLGPVKAVAAYESATSGAPTVDCVAAEHIRLLTSVEPGTRMGYERLWKRTWSPLLGAVPADVLTADLIAEATQHLSTRYSAKSLKNQRGLLAAVCARIVEQGHLSRNPTTGLRLPRSREHERPTMRILTEDETERVVGAVADHYRALVRFLADTGCRWGEAVALQCGAVSLDAKPFPSVHIRQALKWSPDNDRQIGPTKTPKSNRRLPLTRQLADELRPLVAGRPSDALVFTAPRGGPVWHRTFWSDVWAPALERAALAPPRPRIHDLRHGFASRALAAGVPMNVVQRLMGHEHIATTVDTYADLMPDALSQAVQAMEAVRRRAAQEALPSGEG